MITSTLDKDYYSNYPFSYGSKTTVSKYMKEKNVKDKEVDKFFTESDLASRFHKFKRPQSFNPYYLYKKRQLFQADTVYFKHDEATIKANNNLKYLITIIDGYTKFAFAFAVTSLRSVEYVKKFREFFNKLDQLPINLQTDKGSEFKSKVFSNLMKEYNVNHYFCTGDRKCAINERFNATIQTLIYKQMYYHKSLEWSKFINNALDIYNNKIHSTIKMSPKMAERESSQKKLLRTYLKKYRKVKKKKPKYKINQQVRIAKLKTKFKRGYLPSFKTEVFKIKNILTNLPIPRYILNDSNNESIEGVFYENELVPYSPKEDKLWDIEQVLQTKYVGKKKMLLVKWKGYNKKFNSWIEADSVENI